MLFRVKRIGLASSARFGCITGAIAAVPVGILFALVARFIISWLRRLLEGWQATTIEAGPVKVPLDMITLLHLSGILTTLRTLDNLPLVVIAVAFILFLLAVGLLAALTTGWWAMAYNAMATLTGGLTVELEPEEGSGRVMIVRPRQGRR